MKKRLGACGGVGGAGEECCGLVAAEEGEPAATTNTTRAHTLYLKRHN